jgi:hypothetical protein
MTAARVAAALVAFSKTLALIRPMLRPIPAPTLLAKAPRLLERT